MITTPLTVERASFSDPAVREAWIMLQHAGAVSTPFLTWEWCGALAQVAELVSASEVLLCRRDGRVTGLLPIEIVERQGLRTLGVAGWHWFTPDHLDVVSTPDDRAEVALAIATHIAHRRDWDVLDFDALAELAALTPALRSVLRRPRFVARDDEQVVIRTCVLRPDGDAIISKGSRKRLRRELRSVEEQGGSVEMLTRPDEVVDLLDTLMVMHNARFGDRSTVFATDARRRFHRIAARQMSEAGQARIARMRVGADDVALSYQITWDNTICFYSGGLRPDLGITPGFALRAWAMTQAAAEGYTAVDFLRGEHDWKARLADGEVTDTRLRFVRVNPRAISAGVKSVIGRRLAEVH